MLEDVLKLVELGNLVGAIGIAESISIAVDRAEAFKAIALCAVGIKKVEPKAETNMDLFLPVEAQAIASDDDMFDKFWGVWPKKRGSKSRAKKYFKSIIKGKKDKQAFVDMLCADVLKRFESNQQGHDRIHISSYLSGERWEDEIIDDYPVFHRQDNQQSMFGKPQSTRDMTLEQELSDTSWAS